MAIELLSALVGRSATTFVRAAKLRGLSSRVARALEASAIELHPGDPLCILSSRVAFEEAAMHAVIGDAGNLELSYGLVDALASTVESLGLARASDVPDPFRRVWISAPDGGRCPGVVVRCEQGEVAVFTPPTQELNAHAGENLRFSYRGFSSSVDYDLCLNDAVRLPGALVLHLNRSQAEGAIGRVERRFPVRIQALVRALGDLSCPEWRDLHPCQVLDVSACGLRIASALPFGPNHAVEVEVLIPDGEPAPITLPGIICWNREDRDEGQSQGLELEGLVPSAAQRYKRYVQSLGARLHQGLSTPRVDGGEWSNP